MERGTGANRDGEPGSARRRLHQLSVPAGATGVRRVDHDAAILILNDHLRFRSNPTNKTAITAINALAKELADRYSPRVGLTRSWDWSGDDYPVIMDNMMNLEVLFTTRTMQSNAGMLIQN